MHSARYQPDRPSPLRWTILFLLFAGFTLNIVDRQALSLAAPVIREQFHLSSTQYGFIVFAFLFGMVLGQIPAGLLFDRKGPRFGFSLIVTWWSVANLMHAFAGSLLQFGSLRFLLGLGECGSYSGSVKTVGRWFPEEERSFAGAVFVSGSLAGSVLAPPLIVFLTLRYGWQAAFLVPSSLGFVWLAAWLIVYREPGMRLQSGQPTTQPADYAPKPMSAGWLKPLLRLKVVWGVILIRALTGPVSHFYWYWLPEYLKAERGMGLQAIGLFAWLPYLFGGAGGLFGGWFSGLLLRRGWPVDRARKTAFLLSVAVCLTAALVPFAPNAPAAIPLICLASAGINSFSVTFIGLLTDLFPQHLLARVSGLTGIGDGVVSMFLMLTTGIVVQHFSYLPVFIAAALMPVLGLASLYGLVRRVRKVEISLPSRESIRRPSI